MEQELKRLTLQELDCFLRVARIGSIREVARTLSMETAQLSRMMKRLETRLGIRLFDRSARGLALTPAGREVFASVEKIWSEVDKIREARVQRKKSAKSFSLNGIGASPYLAQFVVAPACAKLHAEKFLLQAQIAELPADRLVLSGLRGHIDVALHTGDLGFPKTWTVEKIGTIKWYLYGSKARTENAVLSIAEVEKLQFVYPVYWSPEGLRDGDKDFPLSVATRDKCVGVTSAYAAIELIRTTDMVSYLPEIVAMRAGAGEIKRVRIKDEVVMKDDLYMSFRSDALTKKAVSAFIEAIHRVLSAV